jgi:hypothetical protein
MPYQKRSSSLEEILRAQEYINKQIYTLDINILLRSQDFLQARTCLLVRPCSSSYPFLYIYYIQP